MTLSRTGTRVLAAACALTLLFAACGGDDDGDDATDDTTEATESTTEAEESTSASEPEEDTSTSEAEEPEGGASEGDPEAVATAEAINLTLDDFAEGWVEEAPADDDGGEDDIDQCFTTVDIAATTLGEAETPTFSVETPDGSGGQIVGMQTVVFDSPEPATAVVAEVATPEFATCATENVTQGSDAEAVLQPVVDEQPVGEQSAGVAGAVQIPQEDGSTLPALADLHVIRTGSVVSFTITLNVGETPDTAFEQTLAELFTVIADRQAAEA